MCGILAQFSKNTGINTHDFTAALRLLDHRGPDDNDYQLFKNGLLALGHNRLSIVGVDNGKQPITNKDKSLIAIVNGEFYDYKQIKQEFLAEDYQFTTESDSEILLALYTKYKLNCFEKLNGEYGGILYDVHANKLILFRDRNGVKPLFYYLQDNNITIASEVKAILKANNLQPEWNLDYLKQFLALMQTQDHTIFKNIYHVKPAHYMIFDLNNSKLSEHLYWQVSYNKNNYLQAPLSELTSLYEQELVSSVSRRLVADVPVASYLSGGIDSSSCYAIASHLMGKGIDAFTISFDHPDYDELSQAELLVKKYQGKQHILRVNTKDLANSFEQHLWFLEQPVFNPHSVAKYLLSKTVRDAGFKVVLTGEGADEYNGGYIATVLDQAKFEANSTDELNHLKTINAGVMLNVGAKELNYLKNIFGFSPTLFENGAVNNTFFNDLLLPKYQTTDLDGNIKRWVGSRFTEQNVDVLNISLSLIRQVMFSYVLIVLGDRCEMAHSVEARTPFLDHNLIELLAKVPPHYKIHNNRDKFLLREAVKKYVTPSHYATAKHPFSAPPLVVSKASAFYQLMHDEFSSQRFSNMGLFDSVKVLSLLNDLVQHPNNNLEKNLVQILSVALLHKTFNFKNL